MSDIPRNNAGNKRPDGLPVGTPFQPGNGGRPKGSRNKLGEAFIADLYAAWQQCGNEVIARVISEKPDVYLKVIASILPKQLEIKEGAFDGISDDQLAVILAAARNALGIVEGGGEREGTTAH